MVWSKERMRVPTLRCMLRRAASTYKVYLVQAVAVLVCILWLLRFQRLKLHEEQVRPVHEAAHVHIVWRETSLDCTCRVERAFRCM